jgi:hypothetical protein
MHPQAGLDASATWLDFHSNEWFEFIESGAPHLKEFEPPPKFPSRWI